MFKYVNRWIKAGVLVVVIAGLVYVGINVRPQASEVASVPQFAGALFLTNSVNSTIDVLDEKFNRIIKSSTPMAGTAPGGLIAINDSSQKMFVAYPSTKKVLVYDISSADKLFNAANTVTLSGYKDRNGITYSFKTITSIKSVGQTIYIEQYDRGVKTSTIDIIAISAPSPSQAQLFNILPSWNMNLSGTPLMAVNASGTVLCVTQNDNLATSSDKDDAIKCFSPQGTDPQLIDPTNPDSNSNRQYWTINAPKEYSPVPVQVRYTNLVVTDYYGGQANYKVFAANSVAHKLTAMTVPKVLTPTWDPVNATASFITFGGTLGGLTLGSGQIAGVIGQRLFVNIGADSTISVIDPASTDYLPTTKLMKAGAPVPAKMVIGTSDSRQSIYFVPVSSTQTGIDKYVTSAVTPTSTPPIHTVLQLPNRANIPIFDVAFGQAPLSADQAAARISCNAPAIRFNNTSYAVSPGGVVTIPALFVNPNSNIAGSPCSTVFTPQVTVPAGWTVSASNSKVALGANPAPAYFVPEVVADNNGLVSAQNITIPFSQVYTALSFTFKAPLTQSNTNNAGAIVPVILKFGLTDNNVNHTPGLYNLPVNIKCDPTVTVNAVPYTGNHKLIYTIKNNSLACNATWSTVSRTTTTVPPAVITTPPNGLTSNQVPSIAQASGIAVTRINGGMTTFTSSPGSAAKVTVNLDPNPADTYSSWYNLRANTNYYEWIYVSNLTYLATTFDKTNETFTATKFTTNGTSGTPPAMPNPTPGSTCLAPVITYGNANNAQALPQSIVAGGTLTVPLQITNNNSASSNCSTQYTLVATTISGPAWTFQNYVFGASSPVASGNITIPYLVGYPVSAVLLAPRSPATVVTGAKLRFTISSVSNSALSKAYDTAPINVTPSPAASCSPLTIRGNGWAPSSVPAGGTIPVPIKFINPNHAESLCSKNFVLLIGLPNGWTITDIDNTLFSAPYASAPLSSRLISIAYQGGAVTSITFQAPLTPANGGAITFTTMPSYSSQEQANFSTPVNVLSAVGVLGTPDCTLPANPVVTSLTGPTRVTINGVDTNVYNGTIKVASQDTCNLVFSLGLKYLTNPFPAGWTATINPPTYNPSDYSDYYHTMVANIQIRTPYGVNLNGNYGNVISATITAGTGGQGTLH